MSSCSAAVVESARRGDEEAFEQLVECYQMPLFNLCWRMLGEAGEAEDAAQETFLRAYLHFWSYDPSRGFKNWLFAIATHYCIDCLRRRRLAWQPFDADHDYGDALNCEPASGPEQAAVQAEGQRETQALLAHLAPKDRAVVAMYYWGDMSYAEMAAATGTSVGAVKSRLHRARARLVGRLRQGARTGEWLSVLV